MIKTLLFFLFFLSLSLLASSLGIAQQTCRGLMLRLQGENREMPKIFSESIEAFPIPLRLPTREEPSPYASEFHKNKSTLTISKCDPLDRLVLEIARELGDKEVGAVAIVDKFGKPLTKKFLIFTSGERNEISAEIMNQAVARLLSSISESDRGKINKIIITHNHPKLRDFPILSREDLTQLNNLGSSLKGDPNLKQVTIILSAVQNSKEGKQSKHSWPRVLKY